MKRIFLDTSFLLVPYQFKVDVIGEIERIADFPYQLFIVDKTIDELDSIMKTQKGKDAAAARFAHEIIRKENIRILETTESFKNVDRLLIGCARPGEDIVATQDRELKARLKENGIRIIGLRQKTHLTIN